MPTIAKRVVYILRSDTDPSQSYIGLTSDMDQRLQWHNHGPTGHTLRYRPWSIVVSLEFRTEATARLPSAILLNRRIRVTSAREAHLRRALDHLLEALS